MAHAASLRLLLNRSLRPIGTLKLSKHQGQLSTDINHTRGLRARVSPVIRADQHDGKIRSSFVTRASTSGSSFRGDASDSLSQEQTGKGPESLPQTGARPGFMQISVSLTCSQGALPTP